MVSCFIVFNLDSVFPWQGSLLKPLFKDWYLKKNLSTHALSLCLCLIVVFLGNITVKFVKFVKKSF